MRYFCLLILFSRFLVGSLVAQTFTSVTTTRNFETNRWTDTVKVARIWLKSDGMIDSAVVEEWFNGPHLVSYYPKWSRAVYAPVEMYHNVPLAWKQFGVLDQIPNGYRSYQFFGQELQSTDVVRIEVRDSFIISVAAIEANGPSDADYANVIEYDEHDAPKRLTISKEQFGIKTFDDQNLIEREYDNQGRVISARLFGPSSNGLVFRDSQSFIYYDNNTLRTATRWIYSNGKLDSVLRVEFVNWKAFRPNDYWFGKEGFVVGGEDFTFCSVYIQKAGETGFKPSHTIERKYTSNSLLESETRKEAGTGEWQNISYDHYPNSDPRFVKQTWSYNPDVSLILVQYDNYYNSSGLLDSSFSTRSKALPERTVFYYSSTSSVERLSHSAIADTLSDGPHVIRILNIAGQTVETFITHGQNLGMPPLPSGLYFISIDGGRPRKHLIP
jgi:hypothetical protein